MYRLIKEGHISTSLVINWRYVVGQIVCPLLVLIAILSAVGQIDTVEESMQKS